MKALEHKIPPPLLLLLTMLTMGGVVHFVWPVAQHALVRTLAGAALGVAGLAVAASGFRRFQREGTTFDPVRIDRASRVVTGGVFRYTRNPMYVGMTVVLCGWAVFLVTPWAWVGPAFFAAFTQRFQILPEERVMRDRFGEEFAVYMRRVRRWV